MLNIIGTRKYSFLVSGALFLGAVVCLLIFGLKPGIDFTGGSLLEVSFTGARPETPAVRTEVENFGWGEAVVQTIGDKGFLIKTKFLSEDQHQAILSELRSKHETDDNKVLEEKFETIGPSISSQLKNRTFWSILVVNLAIILFIAYTFRRVSKPVASWKYGITAVIALVHDVTITAGIFAVLGKFWGVEVGIPFVVALLTVLGYSVNDTIVVFDRLRENLIRKSMDNFDATVNFAVNETLARSINTTMTTLLVLAALVFFGGDTIKNFALALLIGIFLGAYSSIFVASPLLVEWEHWSARRRAMK